ncbi:hypothetical protein D3C75_1388210 [compost metagenome]
MPLLTQLLEDGHHLLARMAIEGTGRLIRQDHLPPVHQRTGNTDPLLLAAGKLAWPVTNAFTQPQTL